MNAQERKALKRALISQEKWKAKAKERQKGMRLLQLKIKDLEKSRANWKEKFFLTKNVEEKGQTSESPDALEQQTKADRKKN